MKNIPLILFILLIFLATSCASKKNVTTSVTKVTDTVYIKTETGISAPVLASLTLENICDSTGISKEMEYELITKWGDTSRLILKNNRLQFLVDQKEQVIKQKDSVIKSKETLIKESSEKVKYRTNWKWILGALVIGFALGYLRPWRFLV